MAEAAVTFLLDNVQKLLVEQMHLISGAEKELKQLQIELELMNAFLMEYADKREKGRVFIQFERQIREAVYEAEDILDACLTQKAQSAATTIRNFMHLHDLAEKVNELRLQLQPIFDRAIKGLNALPIAHPSAATPDDNKFKKTQLLREDNVVGFADEEATLMKYLKEKTEQLDVISIVGMPGLGKTTLAWKIYRDPKIQFEFPTLIWVYVSQELNVREVFLTILKHFTREDMSGKGEWELTQLVRSHLDKGRFLLFMDDVWSVEEPTDRENRHCLARAGVQGRHLEDDAAEASEDESSDQAQGGEGRGRGESPDAEQADGGVLQRGALHTGIQPQEPRDPRGSQRTRRRHLPGEAGAAREAEAGARRVPLHRRLPAQSEDADALLHLPGVAAHGGAGEAAQSAGAQAQGDGV